MRRRQKLILSTILQRGIPAVFSSKYVHLQISILPLRASVSSSWLSLFCFTLHQNHLCSHSFFSSLFSLPNRIATLSLMGSPSVGVFLSFSLRAEHLILASLLEIAKFSFASDLFVVFPGSIELVLVFYLFFFFFSPSCNISSREP